MDEASLSSHGHKQLKHLSQSHDLRETVQVYEKGSSGRKDLVYSGEQQDSVEREEIVVTLQGFILRCNLSPITRNDQLSKNPVAAKQSLVLTGLGNDDFETAARAVLEIHTLFASTLPDNALLPWKPIRDEDFVCIEFSNRFFETGGDSESRIVQLSADIDPMGFLRAHCPTGRHTEDNVVLYYERHINPNSGEKTYLACKPVCVRVGQLVEIQASFCTVPITKGRHTMLSKLRVVCILGNPVQEDLNNEIFKVVKESPRSPTKKTKRNVGYESQQGSQEETNTTAALKRLRLEDTSMDQH
ncbi:hypothetical protein BDY19DRAFT_991481 [Irpex rosettiformis]|uniref:Uncharacterized protein n=1 Tax=Irpex rosettiformis TaxID=378272 RepID=A0ACB8UBP5_9APHY|nr:hypothetical protein BDY19DRAFT_991481 [Irpex rosettiformis]